MQHNHPLIAYAYHFMCEAILIFMIFLPVLYHRYFFVPYWSYLGIITLICLLFTLLTWKKANRVIYFLMVPIVFIAFYLLDYPFLISIFFSVLLVWSYVFIRMQQVVKRESLYILLTVIATIYVSIFVHDSEMMIYPFLQFVLLFLGYISSHLVHVGKNDRKDIDRKIPFYFLCLLAGGAVLSFVAYPALSYMTVAIWTGIINLVGGTILGFSNLLSFWQVEKRGWPEQSSEEAKLNAEFENRLPEYNVIEEITGLVVLAVGLLLIIVLVLVIVMILKNQVKKRLEKSLVDLRKPQSPIQIHREESQEESIRISLFNRKKPLPDNPIRKMVLQFEKKAVKYNKGREPYETVEDWFHRVGIDANFNIYQRVRYGNQQVNEEDQQILKKQLKMVEDVLFDKKSLRR
ncbi:hypothetical protein KGF86_18125 [Ornithinibacillus massiliensis]|uniref:DUF4129 domain-containing protein n=1 Tax=Ornithinibacillus massiliensis TaxID=1944633 RepID=A0ABS5MJT0_9BACI|nr:hypothetical protein [Ornithinibacillus massiliensis]MBS3682112.1 hypothetical protein [Ornithinibacillus massiliensis]